MIEIGLNLVKLLVMITYLILVGTISIIGLGMVFIAFLGVFGGKKKTK